MGVPFLLNCPRQRPGDDLAIPLRIMASEYPALKFDFVVGLDQISSFEGPPVL
jgi:hypothetical protein